jgi:hypothetical protein
MVITQTERMAAPSPALPTEGEGVRRRVGLDGATASMSTSPLVGEVGSGVAARADAEGVTS